MTITTTGSTSGWYYTSGCAYCGCATPHYWPTQVQVYSTPSLAKACEHCFCRDQDFEGKAHLSCCMCGTRKVAEV